MSGGEIFGYGWREDHARAGDDALDAAVRALAYGADQGKSEASMSVVMAAMANSQALAAIAQAHYTAANVRARPIRDAELPSEIEPGGSFTTGPYRAGGCRMARFDHASPPYGPQCEWPTGHAGDHVFPA